MYRENKICIVVPAYNEEKLIIDTLSSIPDYVDSIVVVDDKSTDSTLGKINQIDDTRLEIISHKKNQGVGAAIISGYKKSMQLGCDITAVMAGDNQMDPNQLTRLLDPLVEDKCDYSKGNRLLGPNARKGMPRFRLFGNSLLSFMNKLCSGYWDIMDPQNGYTALRNDKMKQLPLENIYSRYGYPNDMLIKLNALGFRVCDIVMPPRYQSEKSKIFVPTFIIRVSHILIKGFIWRLKEKYFLQSLHPLLFFYLMGFTMVPFGILASGYMLYLRIITGGITASSVLIPMFLLIMGFQSLFFAMLFDMQSTKH